MTDLQNDMLVFQKRLDEAERVIRYYSYAGNWNEATKQPKELSYFSRIDYGDCASIGPNKLHLIGGKQAREYMQKYGVR